MNRNNNNRYNNNNNYNCRKFEGRRFRNNISNNNINPNLKKGGNESFDKKDNLHNDCERWDENVNQNMPGIPVNRTVSSPPFVVSANNESKSDKKIELNNCGDGSADAPTSVTTNASVNQSGEPLTQIMTQFSSIDLRDKTVKNEDYNEGIDSQLKPQSITKSELETNNEMDSNRRKGNPIRRNTTGSVDNYRFIKRMNRPFNSSNNNTNYHYNNNNKFYRNDRIHNQRYDSNDANRQAFKAKSFANNGNSSQSTTAIDYAQNLSQYAVPNMYYFPNPCDPYLQSYGYYFANPYQMHSMANQSLCYPIQQTMASNNEESNPQLTINGKQTETNKQTAQESTPNGNYNAITFVPFQKTPQMPTPPTYYGIISQFINENGLLTFYFISQSPPNISPLLLEVDSNGSPILPSNCKIFQTLN